MKGDNFRLGQVTIYVNKDVWDSARNILKGIGISRSAFVNVALTQLVRESEGLCRPENRMDDMVGTLFELSRDRRVKRKK